MNSTIYKKREQDDEFLNSLDACSDLAKAELERLNINISSLKKKLKQSKKEVKTFIEESQKLGQLQDSQLFKELDNLNTNINEKLEGGMDIIEASALKKEKNLTRFTITLFGRTKAGKSTLMEALTNGNGESIGKGDQRTTRDIREYIWNSLRIIDTPGIAAYQGNEDVIIAESVIDETDIILFLVTNDSIQEAEFEKLKELKSQNKPIIILLNVKQAIDREVYRKRFLKNNNEIVSVKGQKGNIERINEYCKKHLNNSYIEIIPIHAMAAYESTRTDNEELKRQLYDASKINKLKLRLMEIIINNGKQRRILTFRDDYIYYLNSLESIYWNGYRGIRPRISYIKQRHKELEEWFTIFKKNGYNDIDKKLNKIYGQLISEIDGFIDLYAGNSEINTLWKKKVNDLKVENNIQMIYTDLYKKAERYLTEFQREINFDMENINLNYDLKDVGDLKKGVMGKVARWGSVAIDVAFAISLTNFWNPAGWLVGVLGVGGAVMSAFTWFFGDDSTRYDKEKSEAKNRIKKQIESSKKSVEKSLKKTFKKNIIESLNEQISIELKKNIDLLYNYQVNIKKSALDIRKIVDDENELLFKEIYRVTFKCKIETDIFKIARIQGDRIKVLFRNEIILKNKYARREMEHILNEKIVYVDYINDIKELVRRTLFPADTKDLIIEVDGQEVTIRADKKSIGRLIGKNGDNIKLANRLLDNLRIVIKEV